MVTSALPGLGCRGDLDDFLTPNRPILTRHWQRSSRPVPTVDQVIENTREPSRSESCRLALATRTVTLATCQSA